MVGTGQIHRLVVDEQDVARCDSEGCGGHVERVRIRLEVVRVREIDQVIDIVKNRDPIDPLLRVKVREIVGENGHELAGCPPLIDQGAHLGSNQLVLGSFEQQVKRRMMLRRSHQLLDRSVPNAPVLAFPQRAVEDLRKQRVVVERKLTAPWQEVLGQPLPGQKACDELEWGAQHNASEVEQQRVRHVLNPFCLRRRQRT